MKLQLTPRFPAQVVGVSPIVVSTANGIVTISYGAVEPIIFNADGTIANATGAAAVVRNNPGITNLTLPDVGNQRSIPLRIVDWSTNVANHQILLIPFGAQTIKRQANYSIYSNAAELGSATLYPSLVLNGWYLAP